MNNREKVGLFFCRINSWRDAASPATAGSTAGGMPIINNMMKAAVAALRRAILAMV